MSIAICLGEIVVDQVRTKNGVAIPGRFNPLINIADNCVAEPGAPAANVALALNQLNVSSGLVACVGKDEGGAWLKSTLEREGIKGDGIVVHPTAKTRQALAVIKNNGERHLLNITTGTCADTLLTADDIKPAFFKQASVLYFGSNSLSTQPIKAATQKALAFARLQGMLLVADANLRSYAWTNMSTCKQEVLRSFTGVDVLKVNLAEFVLLTGSRDLSKAHNLGQALDIPVILVTTGATGAFFSAPSGSGLIPAFPVGIKDTAGAGDAFTACVINEILLQARPEESHRATLSAISSAHWHEIVRRSNAAGALCVSRFGAASAMPSLEQLDQFLTSNHR